jgi:hypothetical protein
MSSAIETTDVMNRHSGGVVVAILVAQFQQRSHRRADRDLEIAARLERIERSLEAWRDEGR